jgi:hypothetical protein
MMKIPTPIAAAAASAQARRSEGITDAGYLDQMAERLAGLPVATARARPGPEPAACMRCGRPTREARIKGNQAHSERADARAAELAPVLTKLQASGITSPRALATALTARNIPTPSRRGPWSDPVVRRVLKRIKRLEDAAS